MQKLMGNPELNRYQHVHIIFGITKCKCGGYSIFANKLLIHYHNKFKNRMKKFTGKSEQTTYQPCENANMFSLSLLDFQ